MNIDLLGDDDWDDFGRPRRNRRPSPHHMRTDRTGMLDPHLGGAGLYRSRSQGHGPQPQINIFNRNQDEVRNTSPYPVSPVPYPPYPSSASRRASPRDSPERRARGRGRLGERLGDEIEDELADMALEHRYGRSRSRVRSDASRYERSPLGGYEWQLAQREAELREKSRDRSRERSRERAWKLEEERIRNQLKLQALEAELRRDKEGESAKEREKRLIADYERKQRDADERKEADEKRAIADFERKQREAREKREAEEKRTVEEYERKQREAKDKAAVEEKRAVEEYERKQREAKDKAAAEELRVKEKMEREAREAKEKKEREYREFKEQERREKEEQERKYNEFLREQKEREEKKKKEEKEAEEKFQAEMRKRLAGMGYTEQTIEVLVDQEKAKQFKHDVGKKHDTQMELFRSPRAPVYPKVHRDYLAVETLKYYDLPWEYDRSNSDYIIILRDMDKRETDLLFEHTSRLRSGKLLLEPVKKDKQFALYRRRSKSRSGAPKEVGVVRLR